MRERVIEAKLSMLLLASSLATASPATPSILFPPLLQAACVRRVIQLSAISRRSPVFDMLSLEASKGNQKEPEGRTARK